MSKFISKDGKLFGKINLIDLIIIIIVLIALIGGIYKLTFVDKTIYIPDYKDGYITLRLTSLTEKKVDAVKMGDVFRVPNIQELGEVVDVKVDHRVDNPSSVDGKVYSVENPLFYEVTVKLKTSQMMTRNDYYYIGKNYKILKGQSLDVTNGILPCKATVLAVDFS